MKVVADFYAVYLLFHQIKSKYFECSEIKEMSLPYYQTFTFNHEVHKCRFVFFFVMFVLNRCFRSWKSDIHSKCQEIMYKSNVSTICHLSPMMQFNVKLVSLTFSLVSWFKKVRIVFLFLIMLLSNCKQSKMHEEQNPN